MVLLRKVPEQQARSSADPASHPDNAGTSSSSSSAPLPLRPKSAGSDAAESTSSIGAFTTATSTTFDHDPPLLAPSFQANTSHSATLSLHPAAQGGASGLLAKITPPLKPRAGATHRHHTPSSIVLVIDVSGSMGVDAPVPGSAADGPAENYGLTVLDLVKHAARTIVETLGEQDRLGIVTFAASARRLQPLLPMTPDNKARTEENIAGMVPLDATNLWHGITEGLKLFEGEESSGRAPALFVLTDGLPNHMCPARGYIPKLRERESLPAAIHTFGFGYSLRSGLLQSLAELGQGGYAFIPDAGMIGTVFVHAVANLQATFATDAVLRLTYRTPVALAETTGQAVGSLEPVSLGDGAMELVVRLGSLQYGQTRDIYLQVEGVEDGMDVERTTVVARLEYSRMRSDVHATVAECSLLAPSTALSPAEWAYHISRSKIIAFLAHLFPLRQLDAEHISRSWLTASDRRAALQTLVDHLPAREFAKDPANQSLLNDLGGEPPAGQVALALERDDYFHRWGVHYLPSLQSAYTRQVCNSFKDAGPLRFGMNSPLFVACRDFLDGAFDRLPPPVPSNAVYSAAYGGPVAVVDMRLYNDASGACFAGGTMVELASGDKVAIRRLRKGMAVRTPRGKGVVAALLRTSVRGVRVCRLADGTMVTPWHPVSVDGGVTYCFPATMGGSRPVRYSGAIFSVLLARGGHSDSDGHAIRCGSVWGVTLGHGITRGPDVRAHAFFGDYGAVARSLAGLGVGADGRVFGGGVVRVKGRVAGFKKLRVPRDGQKKKEKKMVIMMGRL